MLPVGRNTLSQRNPALMIAKVAAAIIPRRPMPTISTFYGITIRMYPADHPPPHSHARYGEQEAIIDSRLASVIRGSLPRGALSLTLMWGETHRDELLENWELCATRQRPNRIAPME